ncbi:MAG: sulfatase [Candidatus Omnitrophica bacterium]|nr:sulfatase [Candidatus Omnitrophota bacterium]
MTSSGRFISIAPIIFLSACCAFFLAAAQAPAASGDTSEGPNVLVVMVNALRADHLGCYGYGRETSPHLDRLAREGVVFERAVAASHWTLPNLVTVFTSQYVCAHQVDSRRLKLKPDEKTMAEFFKAQGYATAAFACGLDTLGVYGLDRGFDVYRIFEYEDRPAGSFADILPEAVRWMAARRRGRFFLFLHTYDMHPPYRVSLGDFFDPSYEGVFRDAELGYETLKKIKGLALSYGGRQVFLDRGDLDHIRARYDGALRSFDASLGVLIGELKRLGLYETTIIVVLGDHGEELGERGTFDRFGNQNLYQEVIHIPLVLRGPGIPSDGRRIASLAAQADVAPTLLDLAGLVVDDGLQGQSLVSLIRYPQNVLRRAFVCSEASFEKWAIVRDDGWKLVRSPGASALYDLRRDPGETRDRVAREAGVRAGLLQQFLIWRQGARDQDGLICEIALSDELKRKLRKAGYW